MHTSDGRIVKEGGINGCHTMVTGMILAPITLVSTGQPVCPVGESPEPGIPCFEGPWEVTRIQDPFTECQGAAYRWNFCRNRKTFDGRPFTKCCAFAYINSRGTAECRFKGLGSGTCTAYLQALEADLARSSYTAISNALVLTECTQELCNNPKSEETGCPKVVVVQPLVTMHATPEPNTVPDLSQLLQGAPPSQGQGPPWAIIGIIVGGVLIVVAGGLVFWQMTKVTPPPMWHSTAAKVVTDKCWIEPAHDPKMEGINMGPYFDPAGYNVVKPRPYAFNKIQKKTIPRALCREAHTAPPATLQDINTHRPALENYPLEEHTNVHLRSAALTGPNTYEPGELELNVPAMTASNAQNNGLRMLPGPVPGQLQELSPPEPWSYQAQSGTENMSLALASANALQAEQGVYTAGGSVLSYGWLQEYYRQQETASLALTPTLSGNSAAIGRPPAVTRFQRENNQSGPQVVT